MRFSGIASLFELALPAIQKTPPGAGIRTIGTLKHPGKPVYKLLIGQRFFRDNQVLIEDKKTECYKGEMPRRLKITEKIAEKSAAATEKGPLLYEGKGKKVYSVQGDPDRIILFFKDSLTAYEGVKKGSFKGKGAVCREVFSLVFRYLRRTGVSNHWIQDRGLRESLCLKSRIIPLEVVVRNRLAGSTAKRLGLAEGGRLPSPLLEYYYKRDDLHDPFVSEDQIRQLSLIEEKALLPKIKQQAFRINEKLLFFFKEAGMELIDLKMEFGLGPQGLTLSDDITPDSCRLWDLKTGFRLDKDRFRRSWGKVAESYQTIRDKLSQRWGEELNKGKS